MHILFKRGSPRKEQVASGKPVRFQLELGCRTLPDEESANVTETATETPSLTADQATAAFERLKSLATAPA